MRKYLNQQEKKKAEAEAMRKKASGTGVFLYQNMSRAAQVLPRPSLDGQKHIPPMGRFTGDSYFKTIKECVVLADLSPATEVAEEANAVNEGTQEFKELNMPNDKLITEVPPSYTDAGQVEYVEASPEEEPLNESKPTKGKKPKKKDILLSEDGIEDARIMI